jgi:hypothetical protein
VRSSSPSGDSYGSPGSVRVVELVDDLPKESTKSACFANRLRILLAAPAQLKILVGVGMTVDNYFGWVSSGSKGCSSGSTTALGIPIGIDALNVPDWLAGSRRGNRGY